MTASFDEIARRKFINDFHLKADTQGVKVRDIEVREISKDIAREYISMFHYSKTFPDSTLYSYGAFYDNQLIGVICYGMGCGKNQYTYVIPDIKNGQYIELTRLWCSDVSPRNTESYVISKSMKLLPESIKLVISFSDESYSHCGIIYQASNFYYLGKNGGGKMMILPNGIKKHPRLLGIYKMRHKEYKDTPNDELMRILGFKWCEGGAKHRYVYLRGNKAEKRKMLSQFKDKIKPYPKYDIKKPNMEELDAISEETKKQGYVQMTIQDLIEVNL